MLVLTALILGVAVDLKPLEDPKPEARYAAARKLAERGAPVVPELVKALDSPRPLLREMAAFSLAVFGQSGTPELARPAIAKLAALLTTDPEAAVRAAAARALGLDATRADRKVTLEALKKGLLDKDGVVRSSSAMALAKLDPTSADAAAELGAAMQRPEPPSSNLHQEACFRLEVMGEAARRGVPGLVHLLETGDPDLRASALEAIQKLGPVAEQAAPALVKLIKESDDEADAALEALNAVRGRSR